MAKLIECNTCKKEISSNADSCPHCGEVITIGWAFISRLSIFFGSLFFLLAWLVIASNGNGFLALFLLISGPFLIGAPFLKKR